MVTPPIGSAGVELSPRLKTNCGCSHVPVSDDIIFFFPAFQANVGNLISHYPGTGCHPRLVNYRALIPMNTLASVLQKNLERVAFESAEDRSLKRFACGKLTTERIPPQCLLLFGHSCKSGSVGILPASAVRSFSC